MPSKRSQVVGPSAGSATSVRYHHDTLKGLSAGMGRFEKFLAIGYVVPGSERRFMARYGSPYLPVAARAAATVPGTGTGSQPSVAKPGADTASPPPVTRAEDWTTHPRSSRTGAVAPAGRGAASVTSTSAVIAPADPAPTVNGQVRVTRARTMNTTSPT